MIYKRGKGFWIKWPADRTSKRIDNEKLNNSSKNQATNRFD